LQETIEQFRLYPDIVAQRGYVDAVDEMRNHIAFRINDGETFNLSFEGSDAAQVQEVTAQLAGALIEQNSKTRLQQVTLTKEFLDTEKSHNEGELKAKETELTKFLAKHPEFARDATTGAGSGLSDRLHRPAPAAKGDGALMALERQAERIATRLTPHLPVTVKDAAGQASDAKLTAARSQAENDVLSAQRDLTEKLAQFTEQHPDVRAAKTRLQAAELKLSRVEEAAFKAAGLPNQPVPAADRAGLEAELTKIRTEIELYKSKRKSAVAQESPAPAGNAGYIVALETEWSRLSREVSEARERQKQVEDNNFAPSWRPTRSLPAATHKC